MFHSFLDYLASSANLPARLYIWLALISFFLSLMIARRTIISGFTGPIIAIFSLYESALGADDRSGPRFQICQGTLRINSSDDQATSNINLVGFSPVLPEFTRINSGLFIYVRQVVLLAIGDTAVPSGLYARLRHTFLVNCVVSIIIIALFCLMTTRLNKHSPCRLPCCPLSNAFEAATRAYRYLANGT